MNGGAGGDPGDLDGRRLVVTGGAGFIGSHVVDALVDAGADVTVLDDLSTGSESFLARSRDKIRLVMGDVREAAQLDRVLPGADAVWHLAANPEVRTGETDPTGHVAANIDPTLALLEGMRRHDVPKMLFTSTSTVYGRAEVRPTPEDYGPLLPISVYGGCKLACEALISSYAETFGLDALLFRFANVVGPRSNHGVTFDFVRKLRADPARLEILGDGTQTKSYISVDDTVAAMVHAFRHAPGGCHPYNIGSMDAIPVSRIGEIVAEVMGLEPDFVFTGGAPDGAGWRGDVKHMALDVSRLDALGWRPRHGSEEAIRRTAAWLVAQA